MHAQANREAHKKSRTSATVKHVRPWMDGVWRRRGAKCMHAPTVVILGFLNNNLRAARIGKIRKCRYLCTGCVVYAHARHEKRVVSPAIPEERRELSELGLYRMFHWLGRPPRSTRTRRFRGVQSDAQRLPHFYFHEFCADAFCIWWENLFPNSFFIIYFSYWKLIGAKVLPHLSIWLDSPLKPEFRLLINQLPASQRSFTQGPSP